jgi:hypothetical protein
MWPEMPDGVEDWAADEWEPLIRLRICPGAAGAPHLSSPLNPLAGATHRNYWKE